MASNRHETVFCLFVAAVAYLWRDNPGEADARLLALLAGLLAVNLAGGGALRRWPGRRALTMGIIAANGAVITALLAFSGGEASNLWVLYLMPIFSACLLLGRRGVWAVVGGVLALNAALHRVDGPFDGTDVFELLVQGGLFVATAFFAHRLAERERRTRERLERARGALSRLVEGRVSRDWSLSHDINAILAVVLGYVAVSLEEPRLTSEVRSDLTSIQKAALDGHQRLAAFRELERKVERLETESIGR